MYLLKNGFDWHSLLLGEEEWSFLPEVLLRSAIMFAVALLGLRLIGKRGIMQGVFELVKDKRFVVENFRPEELSKDEILSDLRMAGVKHLGQVDTAYIEATGKMSVFFLPDEKVDYGLPVLPELYEAQVKNISEAGMYSCSYCGNTVNLPQAPGQTCTICNCTDWVRSINEKRVV